MKLIRIIPRLGSVPELHVFYCAECSEAATIEAVDHGRQEARPAIRPQQTALGDLVAAEPSTRPALDPKHIEAAETGRW
jgi:hypothetical protein